MDRYQHLLVRLLFGAFGLVILAFMIRGTGSLFVGSETSTRIAGPVFLLALACAGAGFLLAVGAKLRELLGNETVTER
jgi:L-asparagine transporter-like permease